MSHHHSDSLNWFMHISSLLFSLFFVFLLLLVVYWFISDITQKEHAIRRNYPIIGRFRYYLEYIGEFLRQYFYAMDREELPFNRAERSWIYRSAKNVNNMVGFGSTRDLRPVDTVLFVSAPFAVLGRDSAEPHPVTIGPYCDMPYTTKALFHISGMSFGALSKQAILALSHGAQKAGCWLNTGEGGLSDYHLAGKADLVFQIGTAKFGVCQKNGALDEEKLRNIANQPLVRMFEIKLSQGAKPGKGGMLPAVKVTEEIARIRAIEPHQDAISPNRHPEISNVRELLDFIKRVRDITHKPTGCKFVLGDYSWLDDLCQEILARGIEHAPDFIHLDSADGGTGASPMSLSDYVGLPIKEALPALVDVLARHGLRERIKIIASGKMVTPADVAWAICVGADFVSSARGFLFSLGCIQAMRCHLNTCPTGITSHKRRYTKGLDPALKSERVYHYAKNMDYEVGVIAHSCGVREPRELKRQHCRLVGPDGQSVLLSELHPDHS